MRFEIFPTLSLFKSSCSGTICEGVLLLGGDLDQAEEGDGFAEELSFAEEAPSKMVENRSKEKQRERERK